MISKFCDTINNLEELINNFYSPDSEDNVIKGNLSAILINVENSRVKQKIKSLWIALEQEIGYQIYLIFKYKNKCKIVCFFNLKRV